MFPVYLKLYNINILDKLLDKRSAVKSCKESISNKIRYSKEITLKLLLQSVFKLAVYIITSNKSKINV